MSGFLIVFIITSIVAWYGYIKVTGALGGDGGNIKVTIEQSRMIREFMDAQKYLIVSILNLMISQRFECKLNVMFKENNDNIPEINCKI
jgi:hypothetical protein